MGFEWISAGIGALGWEVVKQLFGVLLKRSSDKNANKRKHVAEQCNAAKARMTDCLAKAVEYLTAECTPDRRNEIARSIKHELQTLGQSVRELNEFAVALELHKLAEHNLIAFRRAITWHLDSKSYKPQSHNCSDVTLAYKTGQAFQTDLTRLQIAAT